MRELQSNEQAPKKLRVAGGLKLSSVLKSSLIMTAQPSTTQRHSGGEIVAIYAPQLHNRAGYRQAESL